MQRTAGRRSLPALALHPSAEQLKAAYAVNEPVRALLPDGTRPRGTARTKQSARERDVSDRRIIEQALQARKP
jgi:hypothetical protein